jgi:hypothetical protein
MQDMVSSVENPGTRLLNALLADLNSKDTHPKIGVNTNP